MSSGLLTRQSDLLPPRIGSLFRFEKGITSLLHQIEIIDSQKDTMKQTKLRKIGTKSKPTRAKQHCNSALRSSQVNQLSRLPLHRSRRISGSHDTANIDSLPISRSNVPYTATNVNRDHDMRESKLGKENKEKPELQTHLSCNVTEIQSNAVTMTVTERSLGLEFGIDESESLLMESASLQTVTPLDTQETKMFQTDQIVLDYEAKVRPSEYFAERFRASKQSKETAETLIHECRVSSHPLQDWQEYILYVKNKYSNDPLVEFQIRQRCVRSCIYMPQYKNDVEFVKDFIQYAKLCHEPLAEFEFTWKCQVGRDTAMFWMCWTWFAEKARDYRLTLKLFEKSLECVQEKINYIKKRFTNFKLRMRDLGIDLDTLRNDDDDDSSMDCEIVTKETNEHDEEIMLSITRTADEMVKQALQENTTKYLLTTKEDREATLQNEGDTQTGKKLTELMEDMKTHGLIEGEIVKFPIALAEQWVEPYDDRYYTTGETLNDEDGDNEEVETQDDMKHNAHMVMFRNEDFRFFLRSMYIDFGLVISPDVITGNWYLKEFPSFGERTDSSEVDGSNEDSLNRSNEDSLNRSNESELDSDESIEVSRQVSLIVKSFCPKHVSGGCATHEQIFDLNGTDGHDMFPPSHPAKTDGVYADVARDDLEIENPKPISVQIVNLCWGKLNMDFLTRLHKILPYLPDDHTLFKILEKLNESSAQACSIFIPILKKMLAKHGLQVGQIILGHSDLSMTKYYDVGGDVHTVLNDPMEITKHFDDVPVTKDYHATFYNFRKNLHPKEHKIACNNQFRNMMFYHGDDCGAKSQQDVESWISDEGKRKIFNVLGVAPNVMNKRQRQDINGRIIDSKAMNIATNGAPSRKRQSNLQPIRLIKRQTKFERKKCPKVLENGKTCNGDICSGGYCPKHGGGQRKKCQIKKCPFEFENGDTCNKTIRSGGYCPKHGGGQRKKCQIKKCPFEFENGDTCNKTIVSGDHCPKHGGGQKKKCPFEFENGDTCNKTIVSGGYCPNHGGGQYRQKKKCPFEFENGDTCNKTIVSGDHCPKHGGGQYQKSKKCPKVLENGDTCNKTIVSGDHCPKHGGGQKKKCPKVLENGDTCNKTIRSGEFCPNHGGGQRKKRKKCPKVLENGDTCNKTIRSGRYCPNHGGGQVKKCPKVLENGDTCNKTIRSGGYCPNHGSGAKKG